LLRKVELLEYMKQDIYLLGGIMQRAQDIYWGLYEIDIVTKITLSSLALAIFRKKYYDDEKTPISIPTMNFDSFIRLAYYVLAGKLVDTLLERQLLSLAISFMNKSLFLCRHTYSQLLSLSLIPVHSPCQELPLPSTDVQQPIGTPTPKSRI